MKRRKIIIALFSMMLLNIILYFSCHKRPEEISFKNKLYLRELSLNSDLPMQLMEKVDLTEWEKENFFINPDSYVVQIAENTKAYVRSYPYGDSENIYITLIYIYDNNYNVLGLSIGDNLEKLEKTMKHYGYMRDISEPFNITYKKGEVYVRFYMSSDNYIEEICVFCYRHTLYNLLIGY